MELTISFETCSNKVTVSTIGNIGCADGDPLSQCQPTCPGWQ